MTTRSAGSSLQDPFYVVKDEVTQSMQGITALHLRWRELLEGTNTATNEEFKWTSNELKTGLKSIEYDLTDLQDTITVVENNRTKFKIDEGEILTRKGFINSTKQKIQSIKEEVNSARTRSKMEKDSRDMLTSQKPADRQAKLQQALEADNEEYIQSHEQNQKQIIRKQDDNLGALSDALGVLKQQADQIDESIKGQEILINETSAHVDRVDGNLKTAIKKVNELLDSTKDSTQWCIIAALFLVLIVLLVLVIMLPSKGSSSSSSTTTS